MYCMKCFLSWRDVAGLWCGAGCTGVQLLPWALLRRDPRSAPESLGPGPHSHLGHWDEECADLMMHRKSEEPHSDPGPAIGQLCASEKPGPLRTGPPHLCTKAMWRHSVWMGLHWRRVLLSPPPPPLSAAASLGCSTSAVTSAEVEEVSEREDREQEG